MYGAEESRIELLPQVVRCIREAGHYCEYTTIGYDQMCAVVVKKAEAEHKRRYKDISDAPSFDANSVDLSCVRRNARYFYSWSFASSAAIAQSKIMDEPLGEEYFTFGKTSLLGTFAFECTTDANRKIIPRLAYFTIKDENTST